MVDNSQSMLPLQSALLTSFPAFANALKALPGGLPDLHLGVVSSDTGPGKFDLPPYHCAFAGDRGQFQSQPRGICAASPLQRGPDLLASQQQSADQELHRRHRRRVLLHRGARRSRLRVRGPAQVGALGAGSVERAVRQRGLPATRRVPGGRAAHQRGRLLDPRRFRSRRPDADDDERSAGPALVVALQRVRSPVQHQRDAAVAAARAVQQSPGLHVQRRPDRQAHAPAATRSRSSRA